MGTLAVNGAVVFYIRGELTFATVPILSKNHRALIRQNQRVTFDLSEVTFSDNIGVALLVALVSYAKKVGKEITFVNLPSQLLTLLTASKVREILPIISR